MILILGFDGDGKFAINLNMHMSGRNIEEEPARRCVTIDMITDTYKGVWRLEQ